jgi:cycloeucalenol cycloisomerase
MSGYWFSKNPDRAWAEKLYLIFIPIFFIYNAVMQQMGWVNAGDLWHIVQDLLMWLPYCVLLPWFLRRKSGVVWYHDYWFKFQIWVGVFVFFATYFHTEAFFKVLGMRYNFPNVTLYFDSWLAGPDQATALQNHEKIPLGIYLNTMAFFTIYHNAACVVMRRVKSMTISFSPAMKWVSWVVIVAAASYFFAYAETFFYIQPAVANTVYYLDKARMLAIGTYCYMLYFIVSFPNVYRLDEPPGEKWSLSRCAIEASFVSMLTLLLIDLYAWVVGPIV